MRTTTLATAVLGAALTAVAVLPMVAHAEPEADMSTKLAGRTVFLDPGHQGTGHSENLSKQVDNGRGGTKDCQTTGMTTPGGVAEHTINWNVSQLVKSSLESLGAKVVLSRKDDSGWGGCVDERARAANNSGADVAVSIHADSAPASARGFHLIVPKLPVPNAKVDEVQRGRGAEVTKSVRDAYKKSGFTPANYAGAADGIQTRDDIAGPALTTVPLVFVEMGNGANAEDAKLLETGEGQLKHAVAITTGLVHYLLGANAPTAPAPASGSSSGAAAPSTSKARATRPATPPATAGAEDSEDSEDTEDTEGTEDTDEETSEDAYTEESTPTTKAPATTPKSQASGLSTTVVQILKPLLEAVGLGAATVLLDEGMIGAGTDFVSEIIAILLQAGKDAAPPA